ncbi:MAG: hypothetical protein M1827_003869 [Pycnora praestabilis]|nr:MAG: hypothetical protein M1827_003869 [Pycnora praestabilis]
MASQENGRGDLLKGAQQRKLSFNPIEAYENGRGRSPHGSPHRKLSYNPVGEWVPPIAQEEPVAAQEISKTRRICQVAVAVLYCLLASGIVFGYAALKPVLIDEGAYRDECTKEELERNLRTCYKQEIHVNLMFTVAAVATNVCALPVGATLDKYGPRVSSIIGSILFTIGCLFFALASKLPFDSYVPGYLFLALGGPFIFIASFQLSNTFPNHSGLIMAMLTGAFDSSSAVFLIYRIIYQHTDGSFTPMKFFTIYLIVPAFILIVQLLVMPPKSYKTVSELLTKVDDPVNDIHDSDDEIGDEEEVERLRDVRREQREGLITEIDGLLDTKNGTHCSKNEEEQKKLSGVWGALHGHSAMQQLKTPYWILITLFTMVQMTRINYFVATIRPQYEYLLGDYNKAVKINSVFDVALPLGGLVSVPFIGLILDNTSTPFTLGLLVVMATIIGVLGVLPYMWAAYANVVLFVVYRPLYYTTVSDYAAKVFGFQTFGKVYGLTICLSGLFNFSQSGLDALTHKVFHDDPVPVDLILLATAFVIGSALVGYVWHQSRSMERQLLEDEAEGATEVLMPGADEAAEN